MAGAHHRTRAYVTESARIRQAAYANPNTRCWRCGRTLDQHPPHKTGTPPRWQAGHVTDGAINGRLMPEVSGCNASAGATHGNRNREPHTPW